MASYLVFRIHLKIIIGSQRIIIFGMKTDKLFKVIIKEESGNWLIWKTATCKKAMIFYKYVNIFTK